jgi:large subunit ribosomal protein L9
MNSSSRVMRFVRGNTFSVITTQKRWFDWDPRLTKKDGKPAFTGTKYAFVAAKIPVVLLKDVPGLGPKGAIVDVKRGHARNCLVPSGQAVYGTIWENIDEYADPELLNKENVAKAGETLKRAVPFEWLNNVRIEFQRDVVSPGSSTLSDPISMTDILKAMSSQEEIDLLPSQISISDGQIRTVGRHVVDIALVLNVGSFKYQFSVDVKDKAEVAAAERREAELREAMKMKRPEFVLGSGRVGRAQTPIGSGDDTIEEDDGEDSE